MDPQKLQKMYLNLADKVFLTSSRAKISRVITDQSLYSVENLTKFFKENFGNRKLTDVVKPKVFVVTRKDGDPGPYLLRNYVVPMGFHRGEEKWNLVDAARATSAAPLYFPPFKDKTTGSEYTDGGVGFNNPSELALDEAFAITGSPRNNIQCIISLGTGDPPNLGRRMFNILHIKDLLVEQSTTSSDVHHRMVRMREREGINYFRFNPPLDAKMDLDINERDKLMDLVQMTKTYLGLPAVKRQLEDCAKLL